MSEIKANTKEQTPVDDVRKVRERFSREAGGDISKLAAESRKAFERFRSQLDLKLAAPPDKGS